MTPAILADQMKHWQETSRILETLAQLTELGRSAALATVVRIQGSSYRRPGAKMLIADDGAMSGSVSGGCLEADVKEVALSVLANGTPRLLHYDTGGDDTTPFGLGLGCNGAVDIFLQLATAPEALETARCTGAFLQGDLPFAVATIIDESRPARSLVIGPTGKAEGGTGDAALDRAIAVQARGVLAGGASLLDDVGSLSVFTEVLVPPPTLLILGAGEDSRPLAVFASEAGFRVVVVDHRPAFLRAEHYPAGTRLVETRPGQDPEQLRVGPKTYAVVKTHSLATDRDWVRFLISTEVPYIGLLGPRARVDHLLQQVGEPGSERVYGPVGLDLGGEGPEQVALSITAELLAVWSGREPAHLRERDGVIHAG